MRSVNWIEQHLDEIEAAISHSNMPTISKIFLAPALLFRRKILREIGEKLAPYTREELREMILKIADTNKRTWEQIERAVADSSGDRWLEDLWHGRDQWALTEAKEDTADHAED